jgi:predicted enzyme related to lactoylglutathione lyase
MSTISSHTPGTFCWPELGTTDRRGAVAFYQALFGWQVNDVPMGPDDVYSMFRLDGDDVAAAYTMRGEQTRQGVPPHWMAYVAVTNADETTHRAGELGATVLAAPFDVFDVGRTAVIRDPTGAVFALWQPKRHIGARRINEPGALCWTELLTRDVPAAERFYAALFGGTLKGSGTEYTEIMNEGKGIGGIMTLRPEWGPGVPPHWMTYFAVDDCDASTRRARDLGATPLVVPTDIPNVGRFAVLRDPQGATFAIFRPQRAGFA